MVVMLLLGVHGLLLTVYAALMLSGRSRLHPAHLLLAVPLPFIGEMILLTAECGKIPAKPLYTNPFHPADGRKQPAAWIPPADWTEVLRSEEGTARAFLLEAISHQPDNLVSILYAALDSHNSEISHIAAATLMKLHRQYEDRMSRAGELYGANPQNIQCLTDWIDAIRAYRESGLNEGTSLTELERDEMKWIRAYLARMPKDTAYRAQLVRLLLKRGAPDALDEALELVRLDAEEPAHWRLAFAAAKAGNRADVLDMLTNQCRFASAKWPQEKRDALEDREDEHATEA